MRLSWVVEWHDLVWVCYWHSVGFDAQHPINASVSHVIDYKKMLQIVKKSGYSGFIGVEAQAFTMDPIEAIKSSKKLLLNSYS